jgi:imidazole glycerol-phosphate synthase subunit HisF
MLKKRVIFTLLYNDGFFALSRNFRLQNVGDITWLERNYKFSQIAFFIDELIILNVSRNNYNEEEFLKHVSILAKECFIPIAAGGGIRSVEQVSKLLKNGADKIVINTMLYESPETISAIAKRFGQQCIVASIDVKKIGDEFVLVSNNGNKVHNIDLKKWLKDLENLSIGEVYLNSIDNDGTGIGYNIELLDQVPDTFSLPLILAGGAGKHNHMSEILYKTKVDAVATAHLFNFLGDSLKQARISLINEGHSLAIWSTQGYEI